MPKRFQRTKENFTCEKCGQKIIGNGYTNHCPKCLWSKHVDLNPGDRNSNCGGMMEPVGAEVKSGEYKIIHRCVKCGMKKINKSVEGDDIDIILKV